MLSLKNICVSYSYKTVLTGVSLDFEKGKIYSLLGENGAGKSTLAHVLCGDIRPTSGSILLNKNKLNIRKPKDAIRSGIVCVHQRPLLASSLSIKDNLRIGISHKMAKMIPYLVKEWLPERNLDELVKDLSEQEVFNTSLAGALLKNPGVIILDEPPFLDATKIRELAKSGIIIIIITHSFKEAIEKSDEIVMLKDGEVLEISEAKKLTEEIIKEKLFGLTKTIPLPPLIQSEPITENTIIQRRIAERRAHKIPRTGYIPSDRTFRASNPNLSVLQLLTGYHTDFTQNQMKAYAKNILHKADVNIKLNEKAYCLSGGMLQRLILEKELAENPDSLYLFNPTHGLDAEATEKLYERLKTLTEKGTKVIIGNNE